MRASQSGKNNRREVGPTASDENSAGSRHHDFGHRRYASKMSTLPPDEGFLARRVRATRGLRRRADRTKAKRHSARQSSSAVKRQRPRAGVSRGRGVEQRFEVAHARRLRQMPVESCFLDAPAHFVFTPTGQGDKHRLSSGWLIAHAPRRFEPSIPGMPMSRKTSSGSNSEDAARP